MCSPYTRDPDGSFYKAETCPFGEKEEAKAVPNFPGSVLLILRGQSSSLDIGDSNNPRFGAGTCRSEFPVVLLKHLLAWVRNEDGVCGSPELSHELPFFSSGA